jgi:Superfamily II RNA helicase
MVTNGAASPSRSRILAVLGPTNTGKTHLAMERMLGHSSGMIGFPLRLLARENYERAIKEKGANLVALITGEERILPAEARYFLCTVESMPLGRRVDFLAIDEIQMCADPDRGHIFTDRLLHARGERETMLMGADTIRPLLRRLVPAAEFDSRPRFSQLSYTGACKLSRLPPRSAVVAFSVADVYALAELVRRQRGGTAIVLGALSPRTRNAQVALYQAGEVDYLVATDAIGMGLNMHVDHVAFAATRKFDGRTPRPLTPAELAQIAGRAGRFTKNGSFGTTAEVGALDPELVQRIENHHFDPLESLFWRESDLTFTSLGALRGSLARLPRRPGLARAREADDERALAHLAQEADIETLASGPETIRLLWEVCQIPDFGKVLSDGHARLQGQIFRFLAGEAGRRARLPADWVAKQVDRINRTDGDIEALMQRIAGIRTWTYVAHRPDWLDDAAGWQERTRSIEDKLSDALHERLIQRFVDRRTASLVVRIRERRDLITAINAAGEVVVEGHVVGTMQGFRFVGDLAPGGVGAAAEEAKRAVNAATERALRGDMSSRLTRFESDADEAFTLADDAHILWNGAPVAALQAGAAMLSPRIEPLASDLLPPQGRERVRRRLGRWLDAHLHRRLPSLFLARDAILSGAARGLVYQLAEALGTLPRRQADAQLAALDDRDRQTLRGLGLRLGRESVWFSDLLKPPAVRIRAILWAVHSGTRPITVPPPGLVSLAVSADANIGSYEACGYRVIGPRAIRVDMLERLAARLAALAREAPLVSPANLATMIGCPRTDLASILAALGYREETTDEGVRIRRASRRRQNGERPGGRPKRKKSKPGINPDSPFAPLRELKSGQ